MSEMLINGTQFSAKDVYYTKPKINQSGGKNVGILHSGCKGILNISTPLMLTWGINENDFEGRGNKSYDLSLQFPREQDSNYSADTEKLLKNLSDFEAKLKQDAVDNCKDWFGKKMTLEQIDVLWTPMLKYPKDQATLEPDMTRKPTLRVKLKYYDGVFKMELYDTDRTRIFPNVENPGIMPMNLIEKGQNISAVIQCGGIWFANGKFGTTWKLEQAMVQPRASLLGKCHIFLSETDQTRLKNEANKEVEDDDDDVMVQDSDDEKDVAGVEESKEEVVVDEPVKKRKPVKKKKAADE
tara:strand:+ start:1369 stop:2259 length:891 start_codon:yes stop_codon:yes gene_type:complete